jgi:hypothetical protein
MSEWHNPLIRYTHRFFKIEFSEIFVTTLNFGIGTICCFHCAGSVSLRTLFVSLHFMITKETRKYEYLSIQPMYFALFFNDKIQKCFQLINF